jgi:hypothetical protein
VPALDPAARVAPARLAVTIDIPKQPAGVFGRRARPVPAAEVPPFMDPPRYHRMTGMTGKRYRLINSSGEEVLASEPGQFGGNRRRKIYGRLDCRSAVGALPTGYARVRVFFADEATAVAAGYRPCGTCMREEYRLWTQRTTRPRR